MQNKSLVSDYVIRSQKRLKAIDVLFREESWADVVRECQEAVELSLKAFLRASNIEVPRIHDLSPILEQAKATLDPSMGADIDRMSAISRKMRRDRELSFYGSEDLTPSEFYKMADAQTALDEARWLIDWVSRRVLPAR